MLWGGLSMPGTACLCVILAFHNHAKQVPAAATSKPSSRLYPGPAVRLRKEAALHASDSVGFTSIRFVRIVPASTQNAILAAVAIYVMI